MNHPTSQTEGLTYERFGELYAQASDKRPALRDLFPTANGHRLIPCPRCAGEMVRYPEGYRCLNIASGCSRVIYP